MTNKESTGDEKSVAVDSEGICKKLLSEVIVNMTTYKTRWGVRK